MSSAWQAGISEPAHGASATLAALMHDTRNLVASMVLYCDLLEEPGVLALPFRRYAGELRLVADASQRLLASIASLHAGLGSSQAVLPVSANLPSYSRQARMITQPQPVESLAGELKANQGLLAALAGSGIAVAVSISGGNRPIALTTDDLNRILINLTRNAAEAMQGRGRIQITLDEVCSETQACLRLIFADSGPGIPEATLEAVFSPGYTTRVSSGEFDERNGSHQYQQGRYEPTPACPGANAAAIVGDQCGLRGLGLAIVRSLAASAGGSVRAMNGASIPGSTSAEILSGAAIVLEFPIQSIHLQPAQSETNVPWPQPSGAGSHAMP